MSINYGDTLMGKLEKIADSGESWDKFLPLTKELLKQNVMQHSYSFGCFRKLICSDTRKPARMA